MFIVTSLFQKRFIYSKIWHIAKIYFLIYSNMLVQNIHNFDIVYLIFFLAFRFRYLRFDFVYLIFFLSCFQIQISKSRKNESSDYSLFQIQNRWVQIIYHVVWGNKREHVINDKIKDHKKEGDCLVIWQLTLRRIF